MLQNLLQTFGIHFKNLKNNQPEFNWTSEIKFSLSNVQIKKLFDPSGSNVVATLSTHFLGCIAADKKNLVVLNFRKIFCVINHADRKLWRVK